MTRGIELVNPGSVGLPFDRDPRAAYALVHPDRRVEHRRIPYDHAAAAARMRERFAIGHVTLQANTETLMTPCDGIVAPVPAAVPVAHSH